MCNPYNLEKVIHDAYPEGRLMRTLPSIFLGIIWLPALLPAQPVDAVEWLDNYQEALQQSKATGKPIFLEFRCEP